MCGPSETGCICGLRHIGQRMFSHSCQSPSLPGRPRSRNCGSCRPCSRTCSSSSRSKPMTEPVIVVKDLTRRFGDFTAVDHINFEVNAGEVVGYLGPNGSGKTTTIRMLLGLLQQNEERATVLGFNAFEQYEE